MREELKVPIVYNVVLANYCHEEECQLSFKSINNN